MYACVCVMNPYTGADSAEGVSNQALQSHTFAHARTSSLESGVVFDFTRILLASNEEVVAALVGGLTPFPAHLGCYWP
jgi:hypothetical protein